MSSFFDEKFNTPEKSNIFLSDDEYYDLVSSNRVFYPIPKKRNISNDIDTLSFLGKRVDDKDYDGGFRSIPYGDVILQSHTFSHFDYFKTHTGYFAKRHQSKNIFSISEGLFYLTREYRVNFELLLGSPQAGLTRGSKRSFFGFRKKESLASIQSKYKDGVK